MENGLWGSFKIVESGYCPMQWPVCLCNVLFVQRKQRDENADGKCYHRKTLRLVGNVRRRAFESDRFVKRFVIVLNGVEKLFTPRINRSKTGLNGDAF